MGNYFDSYDPSAYVAQQSQVQAPVQTKQKFNKTSLIPAAAAALSFIPGIGTVAGAALGAGGEALREKLNGENFDLAKIGTEGAISAVPFAAGRVAKLGVSAVKAAHGISAMEGVTKGARAVADATKTADTVLKGERGAALSGVVATGRSASKAAPVVEAAPEAAAVSIPTFMSKMKSVGQDLIGEARGITPGKKAVGQNQLGVADANELNHFLSNEAKLKPGSAKQQLAELEQRHQGWGKQIGDTVTENNRALAPSDITNLKGRISGRVGELVGLPKSEGGVALVGADGKAIIESPGVANHPYLTSLYQDLGQIHDLKSANAFRQKLDKDAINYGRNSNAPDPAKEQIAKAFRGGIDEYVGEAIPQLKGVQTLYSKSADAQDFLKNAVKAPGTIKFNGIPLVPGEAIQGAKSVIGNAAETVGRDGGTGSSLFGKIKSGVGTTVDAGKAFAGQEAARLGVAATGVPVPSVDNMTSTVPDTSQTDLLQDPNAMALGGDAAATGIDYNAEADKILNSGLDAKTQSAQLDLLAKRQAIEAASGKSSGGSKGKAMSAAASELLGNVQSGNTALNQLRSELSTDPNKANKNAIAGVAGNAGRAVAGTQGLQAATNEIVDVLSRLRTGAAISAHEEELYKSQLPTLFDTPDTIKQKLDRYQQLFDGIAARAEAGSPSLELAGVAQR